MVQWGIDQISFTFNLIASVQEEKPHKLGRGGHISAEIAGNGQLQGYGWLHLCAVQRGYVVLQDTLRQLIKLFDSEGVVLRHTRRLRCRHYCN